MMDYFWIKVGIRWFTFSRWLHKLQWEGYLEKGDTANADIAHEHYKKANLGLGLALAADLRRAMKKICDK